MVVNDSLSRSIRTPLWFAAGGWSENGSCAHAMSTASTIHSTRGCNPREEIEVLCIACFLGRVGPSNDNRSDYGMIVI